ncbi:MAG: V-type ATPase 116kDa subunit family protein [Waddliaceae bacterium]
MRIDVKKYLFIGIQKELEEFFEQAQQAGLVHFIDKKQKKIKELPNDIQQVTNAIKVLREFPTLTQEGLDGFTEADSLTESILRIKHALDRLEEEGRVIGLEVARIEAFGQFSMDDVAYLEKEGNRKIQFFFAKKGTTEGQALPKGLIHIATDHGLDYFIAINKTPTQYPNMIEMRVDKELQELKRRLQEIQREIHQQEGELKRYQKYNAFLHDALIVKYNRFNQEVAKTYVNTEMKGSLFSVEGWVPMNKIEELKRFLKDVPVYVAEIAIGPEEAPPTYLENKGVSRIGEDLVHIYDTPSNTDKDPSLWVLISFAFFFAIIIGDGGYGLVFLAAALYFLYKNPGLRKGGMRVWSLVMILSATCVVWGLFTHSFFGIRMTPDSPFAKISVLNALVEKKAAYHWEQKDQVYQEWVDKFPQLTGAATPHDFLLEAKKETDSRTSYEMYERFGDGILMEIALLIGIVHISLSLLRYLNRHWAGLGWVIAIIGCYLSFPEFLNATSALHYLFGWDRKILSIEGRYMIYGGVTLAVVLAVIKDKLLGFIEITNVIQLFADVLSYLRLYALGLAGSIISGTVNDIAGSLMVVAGGILLIVGHGLNMVLSIIGGIIHGLRLNFIEWYHYSFDGGGKLYDPLRKMEIE